MEVLVFFGEMDCIGERIERGQPVPYELENGQKTTRGTHLVCASHDGKVRAVVVIGFEKSALPQHVELRVLLEKIMQVKQDVVGGGRFYRMQDGLFQLTDESSRFGREPWEVRCELAAELSAAFPGTFNPKPDKW